MDKLQKDKARERVFKSCMEECDEPKFGKVIHGEIPKWISGSLLRNGPGLFEIGQDKYEHYFDGLAMFHKFQITNGTATYQNKFLHGDTYRKNMEANRIVVSELGTVSHPDPCKNIFRRFFAWFNEDSSTDNCNVNFLPYGDGIYAVTENTKIHRIDTETLDTVKKENIKDYLSVYTSTAHAHQDADGSIYNFGQGGNSYGITYNLVKFPSKSGSATFEQASIVASIPSRWRFSFGYYHSFGFTERFVIFTEQSLTVSFLEILKDKILNLPLTNCLKFLENEMVTFFVIDKSSGTVLDQKYVAAPFFFFHSINAFEDDDNIVFDLCAYHNSDIFTGLTRNRTPMDPFYKDMSNANFARYVLPLNTRSNETDENLVTLDYTTARASLQPDGSILCVPQILDLKGYHLELPQINTKGYNGRKYNFAYAIGSHMKNRKDDADYCTDIIKINVKTEEVVKWGQRPMQVSEPIFVSKPNAESEDDGVILCSLTRYEQDNVVYLVILDAHSFKELTMVEFETPSTVPVGLHGIFMGK